MMVTIPVTDADHFARFLLESFDVNGTTVMVAPGAGFYATEGAGSNQIRVAYVLNSGELKEAAAILKAGLQAYINRK